MKKKNFSSFLIFLILSLVGNACADYALLWYSINKFSNSVQDFSVSYFYLGQALGGIFLAQILAAFFDRFQLRKSSIALDVTYSIILGSILLLNESRLLSPSVILVVTFLITGLSTVHRSTVGYALIKKISDNKSINLNIANFTSALALAQLLGAATSGVVYNYIGFHGCIMFGIISFLPTLYIYYKVFDHDQIDSKSTLSLRESINSIKDGYQIFLNDKILLYLGISIGVLNIVSSVIPSIVGISLKNSEFNESYYFTSLLSIGIGFGIIFNRFFSKNIHDIEINKIIPFSLIPAACILILGFYIDGPYAYVLFFISGCIGSSYRNVATGILRIQRIPKHMVSRVNTIYSSVLYLGQILGALFIVPSFQNKIHNGIWIILFIFAACSIISIRLLPKTQFKEAAI
jgi:predicted MFS family arabinose efflux permease